MKTWSELCAILPLLFQSKASKDSLYDWYSSWSMFSPRMLRYPHFSFSNNNTIKCYIWGLEVTLCHSKIWKEIKLFYEYSTFNFQLSISNTLRPNHNLPLMFYFVINWEHVWVILAVTLKDIFADYGFLKFLICFCFFIFFYAFVRWYYSQSANSYIQSDFTLLYEIGVGSIIIQLISRVYTAG